MLQRCRAAASVTLFAVTCQSNLSPVTLPLALLQTYTYSLQAVREESAVGSKHSELLTDTVRTRAEESGLDDKYLQAGTGATRGFEVRRDAAFPANVPVAVGERTLLQLAECALPSSSMPREAWWLLLQRKHVSVRFLLAS